MVKITKLSGALAATALVLSLATVTAAPASAVDNIKAFGQQIRFIDAAGNPTIGYTVSDFGRSSDPVPHNGELFEATLTVRAFSTWATPLIALFNARARSGQGYPLIPNAPGGISGAQVAPGQSSTGKLYFDVVGDEPNSVVYNDGIRDVLAWVPGPPMGGNRP